MRLTTRSQYGVRLMLDLALRANEGPVQLWTVALTQGIGVKYLEQIVIPLKKAGYVAGVRGPKGGHLLGRPPEEISVGEVVRLLEGGLGLVRCIQHPEECERSEHCVTKCIWEAATDAINQRLDVITFRDLMDWSH